MMKRNLVLFIVVLIAFSCNNDKQSFEKHESGLEYKIITSTGGEKVKIGDVLVLQMSYETEDGDVIFNSANNDRNYLRKLELPKHTGGSIEDGLAMLAPGDSAIFRINAESFLKFSELYSTMPPGVDKDENLIIKVKLIEVLKHDDFDDHLCERYHESEAAEMEILDKFLKNANINVEPRESGLYYVEQEAGSGLQPKLGDYVRVHYTVKLIDGLVLETSLDKKPISFRLGEGDVIPAWEEGISLMKEGGKAMLICPSKIAYGAEGSNGIQPYSTLIFELELVSVESMQMELE